jgi:hypothetical protein
MFCTKPWLLIVACTLSSVLARAADDASVPASSGQLAAEQTPGAKFRVELPDGATIELIGVSEYPTSDLGWWRPDGSPLPTPPGGNVESFGQPIPNSLVRAIALDLLTDGKADVSGPGPQGPKAEWYAQSGRDTKEPVGKMILEKRRIVATMPPNARTTIVVRYAGGPWETVATTGPRGTGIAGVQPDGGVAWDHASDENGAARISAAYEVRDKLPRIIAVDDNNQEHLSEPRVGGSVNHVQLLSARFPRLPIARVKHFRFQTRSFNREIEFRNVSLHRGQRTPFQIYLDGRRYFPRTASANDRLGTFKLVSAVAETKPQTAADADVLKRIFANWQARQDLAKSFHVEWKTRVARKSRRSTSVQNLHRELWVQGNNRFRLERSLVGVAKYPWDHRVRDQRTWNGTTNSVLEWLHAPSDAPQGAILEDKETRGFDAFECDAPLFTLRALHPLIGWQAAQFHVVTRNAIVDGLHCLKLQRSIQGAVEACWVDPNRDDLVVLWEQTLHGKLSRRVAIHYQQALQFDWLPDRWTCHYQSETVALECAVTKFVVNERLPETIFQIDFPPATLVFDASTRKQFLVAADGSRAPAFPFDSVSAPALRQVLDAVADFTLEPEPLEDAVEFIHLHLKIPIAIDKAAFAAAGMNPKSEVQCDIDRLTVREQLRWLTAQLPKPIRLEDRNGTLVLTPVLPKKGTSPGDQRKSAARPIP